MKFHVYGIPTVELLPQMAGVRSCVLNESSNAFVWQLKNIQNRPYVCGLPRFQNRSRLDNCLACGQRLCAVRGLKACGHTGIRGKEVEKRSDLIERPGEFSNRSSVERAEQARDEQAGERR